MRNVTISLDEDLVRRAKVEAAKRDLSLSKYIAGMLEDALRQEDDYERARAAYFARKPYVLRQPGEQLPRREDLYDRPVLRSRDVR